MADIKILEQGYIYEVPTHRVTNDGIEEGEGVTINFCKGSKNDESVPRQEGVFVEYLLEVSVERLKAVNTGDLQSRETSVAITHIETAILWLQKRANDRKKRGVQGTYEK